MSGSVFETLTVVLTPSRPAPHNVIWVCLQPLPPVRLHTAGMYSLPVFTNTCSMPTWWPASLWRNDRQRSPSFQGGVRGRTNRAPRTVLLLPTSGIVRYRPPGGKSDGELGQLIEMSQKSDVFYCQNGWHWTALTNEHWISCSLEKAKR